MASYTDQDRWRFVAVLHNTITTLPWLFRRTEGYGENGPIEAFIRKDAPVLPEQSGLPHRMCELGLLQESGNRDAYVLRDFTTARSPLSPIVNEAYQRYTSSLRDDTLRLPWVIPYMGSQGRQWSRPALIFPVMGQNEHASSSQMHTAAIAYHAGLLQQETPPNLVCKKMFTCSDAGLEQDIVQQCKERRKITFQERQQGEGQAPPVR